MIIDSVLREALDSGATVVTPSVRLARELRWAEARQRLAAAQPVWQSPRLLPWSAWLPECWATLAGDADPLPLTTVQTHTLWETVVAEQPRDRVLLNVGSLAASAAEAWTLSHAYRLPEDDGTTGLSEEFAAYRVWAQAFERACEARGVIDAARLVDALGARAAGLAGRRVVFAGFEELTPQQRQLQRALSGAGVSVHEWQPPRCDATLQRTVSDDPEHELLCAGRWIRRALDSAAAPPRIGLVVPDLAMRRRDVIRLLEAVLAPAAGLPGAAESAPAFNVAQGEPLTELALVDSALAWLELLARSSSAPRAGVVLCSPYLGGGVVEADARAQLDARLRDWGFDELRIADLARQARDPRSGVPQLARLLAAVRPLLEALPRRAGPAVWSEQIDTLLAVGGWPGERPLSSGEYQTVQRWQRLLAEFASLDAFVEPLDYRAALVRLRALAARSRFQPETPPNAVDVLGWADTDGLRFDALWLTGLHDEAWPPAPQANPLLPLHVQRRHGLPGSSAGQVRQSAARRLERLQRASHLVVASWPSVALDRRLHPSPLIEDWPVSPPAALDPHEAPLYSRTLLASARLETLPADAPPAPADQAVPGGARVLQLQAQCPFRAFAELRLRARPLQQPRPGIDPRARGRLAHRALEILWSGWRSSLTAAALDAPARAAAVQGAVTRAWGEIPPLRRVSARLADLERKRLGDAIGQLLAIELERAPFEVLAIEARREIQIGPLQLAIRLDRLDRLAGGARLVIDYKTGAAWPRDWLGERPIEPQLPLYAVTAAQPVDALAFARLRAGEIGYRGYGRAKDFARGIAALPGGAEAADWDAQMALWRARLGALAGEFAAGEARVDPLPGACARCHLATLCRIHERPRGRS